MQKAELHTFTQLEEKGIMVSLERYECLCHDMPLGLELFSSKKEVQYIRCKRDGCGFFTLAKDLHNYLNVIEEKVLLDYKDLDTTLCILMPGTTWVSQSEKNPGRTYFKCGKMESFKVFQWGDKSPTITTMENLSKKEEKKKGLHPSSLNKATMTEPRLLQPHVPQNPRKSKPLQAKDGAKKREIIEDDE